MQDFLIIIKGDGMNHCSPADLQNILAEYKNWVAELGDQYVTGQRLQETGAMLPNKSTILTDGPFLEPKEIIAGFYWIKAKDQEEANAIAKSSPHLGLYQLEVRPLAQPVMK